ncbi:YwpF family protein [Peribacillus glennii]|uniref:YwpF-like protein n=1 Tax=Peribacillus glennii TaxID=2303991 RepID=A0A372L6L2_9BACI|nr:YwpF family protein [Peribacillus glennii]RFU60734.1 hypothetical protein D0466_20485 [Peribacillus glennii]
MKTFKLISLQIVSDDRTFIDIELADGLIINKEDDHNTWIIEAFVTEGHFDAVAHLVPTGQKVNVQAVITKKDNDPAAFKTVVNKTKKVDGHVILLLEGHLQKTRSKYAELLLQDLIQQGIVGDALIEQFKEKLHSRPKLASMNKQ